MRIFRFMSKKEFDKLINGEKLINNTKHDGRTNSEGFCFMEGDPELAFDFLSGVVSEDICVVFETEKELKETYGIYADPYGSFFETITEDELCTNTYNKDDFKIIKMAIPDIWEEWNWYTDIKTFQQELKKKEQEEIKEIKKLETKRNIIKEAREEEAKRLQSFLKRIHEVEGATFEIGKEHFRFKNTYIKSGPSGPSIEFGGPYEKNRLEFKISILF